MKKSLLFLGMMFLTAPAAHADITHKLSSSVQPTVDAAASQVDRIGNTYSVSGNGVSLDVLVPDLTAPAQCNLELFHLVSSSAVIPTAYQTTDGASLVSLNSFTQGDAELVTSGTTVYSVLYLLYPHMVLQQLPVVLLEHLPGTITSAGAIGTLSRWSRK